MCEIIDFAATRRVIHTIRRYGVQVEDAVSSGLLDEAEDALVFLAHEKLSLSSQVVERERSSIIDRCSRLIVKARG